MKIVIVGGGLAGAKAVEGLRDRGYDGDITLLGAEPTCPTNARPFQGSAARPTSRIQLRPRPGLVRRPGRRPATGVEVTGLDLDRRRVTAGDAEVGFDRLLLTTGSAPRRLATADGAAHRWPTCAPSRTRAHSEHLAQPPGADRRRLDRARGARRRAGSGARSPWSSRSRSPLRASGSGRHPRSPTCTGSTASTSASARPSTPSSPTATERWSASPTVERHRRPRGRRDRGDRPRPGRAAGLRDRGVLVDARLEAPRRVPPVTSPARPPRARRRIRVEHWDNAIEQGPAAAGHAGRGGAYDRLPYFFTDQYDLGMEYVGNVGRRGSPTGGGARRQGPDFTAFWPGRAGGCSPGCTSTTGTRSTRSAARRPGGRPVVRLRTRPFPGSTRSLRPGGRGSSPFVGGLSSPTYSCPRIRHHAGTSTPGSGVGRHHRDHAAHRTSLIRGPSSITGFGQTQVAAVDPRGRRWSSTQASAPTAPPPRAVRQAAVDLASVVARVSDTRTLPWVSAPIAASTWLGSSVEAVHADPLATPNPPVQGGDQRLAVDVQAGEGHQVGQPVDRIADHLDVGDGGDPLPDPVDEAALAGVELVALGHDGLQRGGRGEGGRYVPKPRPPVVPVVDREGVAPAGPLRTSSTPTPAGPPHLCADPAARTSPPGACSRPMEAQASTNRGTPAVQPRRPRTGCRVPTSWLAD